MSAWRKLAALGLLASLATASCTVSEGDDDENAGTGGVSASGGSGATGGTGATGGSSGGSGGTGGSMGGAAGTGGETGGSGGTGGMITCDPASATDPCTQCVEGTTCCAKFEACANNAYCGFNETERNEVRCQDACKAAICKGKRPDLTECDEATIATEVTAEDAMECSTYCIPGGTPSAGEFMCTLGCMQGATVALQALFDSTPSICGAACISETKTMNTGTVEPVTNNLVDCIMEGCSACGVSPL